MEFSQPLLPPAPLRRDGRLSDVLGTLALLLFFVLLALLVCGNFLYSAEISPVQYNEQVMYLTEENELTNITAFLAVCVILRLLNRVRLTRTLARCLTGVLFFAAALFACIWTLSVKAIPISDQEIIVQSAQQIIAGDFTGFTTPGALLNSYFVRFPFQFGYLGYTEVLLRIFSYDGFLIAAPLLNVAWLFAGYVAILRTTDLLFQDDNVSCLTAILLAACSQQLLSTTFLYGTIPCMALCMGMFCFIADYMICGRKHSILFAALAAALAVAMKSNAWIYILAAVIVLLLFAIRQRRWPAVLAAALIVLASLPLPGIIQRIYEARIGISFGSGYPMIAWMSMGMHFSSDMASGWYSSYMRQLYDTYGADIAAVRAASSEHIKAHIERFQSDPAYTLRYFREKFLTQWTEPSCMSVWISKTCEAYGELGALAKAIYTGTAGKVLAFAQNQYLQFVQAGSLLYALVLLKRRSDAMLLYPVAMIGAFLFHLLFEANCKYALIYLPMFVPMAACGVLWLGKDWPKHRRTRSNAGGIAPEAAAVASESQNPSEKTDGKRHGHS